MKLAVAIRQLSAWGALIDQPGLTLRGINVTVRLHVASFKASPTKRRSRVASTVATPDAETEQPDPADLGESDDD